MVGLTLIAVVVAVLHPSPGPSTSCGSPSARPAAAGPLVFFGALATGPHRHRLHARAGRRSRRSWLAIALALRLARRRRGVHGRRPARLRTAGRPPDPDDPARSSSRPTPAADRLAPARLAARAAGRLARRSAWWLIPLGVYVVSYIPWAVIENHQLWDGLSRPGTRRPDPARADRPDVRLPQRPDRRRTRRRRRGGPGRSTSSPSGSTRTASPAGPRPPIYDAGNLVIWWLGVPAHGLRGVAGLPAPEPRRWP